MKTIVGTLTLGFALVAGSALASNTGFKLNYALKSSATTTNNNWLALPFFYYPTGVVGTTGNSLDLCNDLNEGDRLNRPKVTQVIRYNTLTDTPESEQCNASGALGAKFPLVAGQGYSVKPKTNGTVINIVGSMDDTYAKPPKGGTNFYTLKSDPVRTNNNWVSVPYHVKADNSLDLCNDLNDNDRLNRPKVTQVIRFNTLTDVPESEQCNASGALGAKFVLVPGQGYSVKPKTNGSQINYDVY